VGRFAVESLHASGFRALRLGARRVDALPTGPDVDAVQVDARNRDDVAAFCAGLRVLVNCAGPSYELKDSVAAAALAAGADYVDVGGDDPAHEALAAAGTVRDGRTAVLSAGTVPGLSVLVPRWLAGAEPAEKLTRLVAYAGGLERCSPTVAADIMLSLTVGGADGEPFGHPLAAWRNGRRALRVLRSTEDAELALYPERVALQPILTAEIERLARTLGLDEADWYNVYPGAQVRSLFSQLPTLPVHTPVDRAAVEQRMVTASEVDLAGQDTYYRMAFTLSGPDATRTAVVRAPSSYRITAFVAVAAARAMLDGRVPPGLHFAGEVLDPGWVVDELRRSGIAEVSTDTDAAEDGFEEGIL
jgi:hypothetical protein